MLSQRINFKTKKESIYLYKFRTFAMIKPDGYMNIGKIIDIVESSGFTLGNLKMAKLTAR